MSSPEVRYHMKKPLLVYGLAICFLAAPVGNIIASMISFGISEWYSPSAYVRFVNNVSWPDRLWLVLTFAAGLALMKQRKWAWILSIGALIVTSIINFHHALVLKSQLSHGAYFFPTLFMLSNLAVVVILFHFRYPYIDRREAWWGVAPRYRCRVPMTADGQSAMIMNISLSGIFVEGASGVVLEVGKSYRLNFGPLSGVQAEVVHDYKSGYGLEFNPTIEQRSLLKQYVADLAETPIGEPWTAL